MDEIREVIKNAVLLAFSVEAKPSIDIPKGNFGDYSTNIAMVLSKEVKLPPREIAEKIISKVDDESLDLSIAGPGFINIKTTARYLGQLLNRSWGEDFGRGNDGAGKTVIVEYPSPNIAKPYSVGHLRPGNQGWAAKNLMEMTGWKVITDNHIGDYGAPFGVWVVGFKKYSNDEALKENGVYELGRIYIETKKDLKEEESRKGHELADEVQDWLLKLEKGDDEALRYSELFNKISLEHMHKVMQRLKISTDYELGELFFAPMGKKAVDEFVEKGLFIKNPDGSVIAKLDEFGIDVPMLMQKSNGAALYATTDLATMLYREREFKPDRIIYAVAAEQIFYFEQLFALAKKIGIEHIGMTHLWFGLIDQLNEDGTREKMSSRKGVVLMEELLDKAEDKARELVGDRDVSEDDIKKIALGAIKFSDFAADRRTNILFDWNTIFALSGFSGPYIQYAAVRVGKILKDSQNFKLVDYSDYDFESEKLLIKHILMYPNVVRAAADELEPHKIAFYLYDLAKLVNKYYEQTQVSSSSDIKKSARVDVLKKVAFVFESGLNILGIEIPTKM